MLFRTLRAEQMKLRHSPVWLAFFILPILPAFMGTFNYLQNLDLLQTEWYSLWTQHTLFSCYFFLPALIGVYCSYLCRLEHLNHNWNSTMTAPVPISCIYLAKLLIASSMVLLTQVWIGVLFIISGKLTGLTAPIPPELPEWLLFGTIGGIVICALQLCISLVIRSFAVPVGLALIGGISGLAALAKGYGVWFPYSLMSLGMRANHPGGAMQCSVVQFSLNCLLYLVVFCLFAVLWLEKRDVKTG
ncbi:ABC transporter permease [Desulfosporosinus fructosivorans]|uniref:ABC transporter permease n=1 Tax=Desulfosporosinus fructosivorans TaxID=2018669 RepID=A0A4Z0QZ38_9FIRM|nr:ABC transporter permease [Desulfosporosinus fructosivorans]TGE35788.1 ABC transporter permease [Desulfosporosinus fructosivorans]